MNYVDKNGLSRFYSKIQSLFALKTSIPTKVSQLSNDSGYQTANNVSSTLQSYAKKSELPTKVSQLTNDSGFLTSVPSEYVTETELNAKGYITEADIESEETTITIAASAWSNGVYTHSDSRITATSNQEYLMPLADGTNATMLETIRAAMIEDAGQSAGKALLRATGTVPTTQIQLRVIFRGEK